MGVKRNVTDPYPQYPRPGQSGTRQSFDRGRVDDPTARTPQHRPAATPPQRGLVAMSAVLGLIVGAGLAVGVVVLLPAEDKAPQVSPRAKQVMARLAAEGIPGLTSVTGEPVTGEGIDDLGADICGSWNAGRSQVLVIDGLQDDMPALNEVEAITVSATVSGQYCPPE